MLTLIGVSRKGGRGNTILGKGSWDYCVLTAERLFGNEIATKVADKANYGEFIPMSDHQDFTHIRIIDVG